MIEIDVDIPEGTQILGALVCLKVFDADGALSFIERATDDLMIPEAMGMASGVLARLHAAWLEEDD